MPLFPYYTKCAHRFDSKCPAILVEGLKASYPDLDNLVLDGIGLKVARGEKVALLGANGAGKSTLFKALVGAIPVLEGSVKILGHPVAACQHQVTYLAQRSEIDWSFPVSLYKLVLSGAYIHQGWGLWPTQEQKDLAHRSMARLQIDHLADRQIGKLSVGQQQRGLIARALVQGAQVYLLDEPFNAVDQQTISILRDVFIQLREEGNALLVATHDKERLKDFFDRAVVLQDNRTLVEVEL